MTASQILLCFIDEQSLCLWIASWVQYLDNCRIEISVTYFQLPTAKGKKKMRTVHNVDKSKTCWESWPWMTPWNMTSQIPRSLRQMHWVQNYRRKWTALLMSSSRAAEPFCKGSAFAPSAFSRWIMGRFKGTVCRHFLNRISRKGGGRPGLRVSLWHWASLLTSLAKLILIRLCITCCWLVDSHSGLGKVRPSR